ncbi:MAG: hypothetical protein GY832_40230 [Chloroflexi bacterium]|nr:hypothetical protein [Chloroflexota bacterium]
MSTKSRLVIGFLAFAMTFSVLLIPGIGVTVVPVCACISTDWLLYRDLQKLDILVHQYAGEHNGLYPTYNEFEALVEQQYRERLTPQVDIATRDFLFRPNNEDVEMLGYAVSSDHSDYVLLGVGLREKMLSLYGVSGLPIGREIHIVHSDDAEPPMNP